MEPASTSTKLNGQWGTSVCACACACTWQKCHVTKSSGTAWCTGTYIRTGRPNPHCKSSCSNEVRVAIGEMGG
eukprot:9171098-Alexandrium_andersonii.AAC.1